MKTPADTLSSRYRLAHNEMRSIDGFQPSEALDELLKYLLFKTMDEGSDSPVGPIDVFTDEKDAKNTVCEIKKRFSKYFKKHNGYITDLFHNDTFRMSDNCIAKVHEIIGDTNFNSLSFDIRSTALRSFLTADLRKGLGIFLTPDDVVLEVANFFDFGEKSIIADPACGSGTFLMAAAAKAEQEKQSVSIVGIDKSPRMMLLAELNIGQSKQLTFKQKVCDTLRHEEYRSWLPAGSVDFILTNPPFGVKIDHANYDLTKFKAAKDSNGAYSKRQSSELLFLEQCITLAKPGGWVGIVLPRSAINTITGTLGCAALANEGAVRAIVTLPPETFGSTGTMTNTVVIFVQKFGNDFKPNDTVAPVIARIDNVGFDSTGRTRDGNQLPGLGEALRSAVLHQQPDPRITILEKVAANTTLTTLPEILKGTSHKQKSGNLRRLGDLVLAASTGATPSRKSYADEGLFLVKVGNLTGSGINWIPRDRNFIDPASSKRRYSKDHMILKRDDILLTSSAHSPRYIAKKIDIMTEPPEWTGGSASYVGEVMLVRPNQELAEPYKLLAYLRLPDVVMQIQQMIRGQTAHLHPEDLMDLQVDMDLLNDSSELQELAEMAKNEALLNEELNKVMWRQMKTAEALLYERGLPEMVA